MKHGKNLLALCAILFFISALGCKTQSPSLETDRAREIGDIATGSLNALNGETHTQDQADTSGAVQGNGIQQEALAPPQSGTSPGETPWKEAEEYLNSENYHIGRGKGQTPEEAKAKAYESLALSIQVNVRSSFIEMREMNEAGQETVKVIYHLEEGTNLSLPSPDRIVSRREPSGEYEILIVLSRQNMEKFRNEMRNEISAYAVSQLKSLKSSSSLSLLRQLFYLYDFISATNHASTIVYEGDILVVSEIQTRMNDVLEKTKLKLNPESGVVTPDTVFRLECLQLGGLDTDGLPLSVEIKTPENVIQTMVTVDSGGVWSGPLLRVLRDSPFMGGQISVTIKPDYPSVMPSGTRNIDIVNRLFMPLQTKAYSFVRDMRPGKMVEIPKGRYLVGAVPGDRLAQPDERPQSAVETPGFYIDVTEVTNQEYAVFLRENPAIPAPGFWENPRFNDPNQPVIGVTWNEAAEYAAWAGKRLPTREEWEIAARGKLTSIYIWGNDPEQGMTIVNHSSDYFSEDRTSVVRQFPPSPIGLYDMAGNVWEWTTTSYSGEDGSGYIVKGGSWADQLEDLRISNNFVLEAEGRFPYVGFRCVKDK